ncbi:MFS transporter [Candidatus Saccharibacteria bacterium]|nr:MFS transporter [Candidatus Saccharibacteria bacterium]
MTLEEKAKKNLRYYPAVKIFYKRVYLPIIAIFYVYTIGFSVPELGILAAFSGLIGLLCTVPTGYIADRLGRVHALRLGGIGLLISSLIFVFAHDKSAVYIAVLFEALGFSFLTGSGEAMVHDSLKVLNRTSEYSKVMSRAQSISLVGNAILIAIVPLTYSIDPRLPFLIGAVAFTVMISVTYKMHETVVHAPKKVIRWKAADAFATIASNKSLLIMALLYGIVCAVYFAFDVFAVALKELQFNPAHLGWVFAGASLLGAVLGLGLHHLKKLTIGQYVLLDMSILIAPFIAVYFKNIFVIIPLMMLSIGFWRFRRIIYQEHLLKKYETTYKATMISAMEMSENISTLWVPILTTTAIGALGVFNGFGAIAVAIGVLLLPYSYFVRRVFK